jgi:hypothetical protein
MSEVIELKGINGEIVLCEVKTGLTPEEIEQEEFIEDLKKR